MTQRSYEYYERQAVLPTYGEFISPEQLAAHERLRRHLFTDMLGLPPQVFEGARVLEFGPDSGENSLVFALWGAKPTLAEPHERAHAVIREYFERFGLSDRLAALESWDVTNCPVPQPGERYDVVDAEGFIYTIQPPTEWLEKLARLVKPDGYAIVDYYEPTSSFLELVWKAVQARYRSVTAAEPFDAARRVFAGKWDSIAHKRSIDSWTMDVLENPFVRLAYFVDPVVSLPGSVAAGFRLHASWPHYRDGLDVHWYKRELSPEEELDAQLEFVRRSRLSHLFGRKHFVVELDPQLDQRLRGLVEDTDALIDGFDAERAERADAALAAVASLLTSEAVLSTPEATERSLATVDAVRRLFEVLARGDADEIATFCNGERALIESWGNPNHFVVFRRVEP